MCRVVGRSIGLGLVFLVLAVDVARAEPADSARYRHPFLTEEGPPGLQGTGTPVGTAQAEELLRHLAVQGTVVLDEDGWRVTEWVSQPDAVPTTIDYVQSEPPAVPVAAVGPSLEAILGVAAPDEDLEVTVCTRRGLWMPVVSVGHELDLAMLRGDIATYGDVRSLRADTRRAIQQAGGEAVQTLADDYAGLGLGLERISRLSGCADLTVPAETLEALIADPRVSSAELANQPEVLDISGYAWQVTGGSVTGYELEDLIQSTQFYEEGYDGDERIGIVDGEAYRAHLGFHDASGNDRVENCGTPVNDLCTTNPDPLVSNAHGTATTSIAVGDITAGQDPLIPNDELAQRERSGVARGATALVLDYSQAWEDIIPAEAPEINLMVKVSGAVGNGLCDGTGANAQKGNALFEAGIAVFRSAGNLDHGDVNDCTTRGPSTAIGVFAVGAMRIDLNDDEIIYAGQSRGGTATEGGGRTIIGMTAPSKFEYPYPAYDPFSQYQWYYGADWNPVSGVDDDFCCTSSSTPALAGAAAVFRDWWSTEIGDQIDQPERLYTQLMLMGDRQGESGLLTTGFDGLWGAGNLRLRKYDSVGMDAPAMLTWGNLCIDHGTEKYLPLHGAWSVLPADIDMLKTVMWWYDSRHENGTPHDKIDLKVQWNDNNTWTDVAISATDDNRQRVHIDNPNNVEYRAVIVGRDVTTDVMGCGTDSMRVWLASYMEDSDRDDVNGAETDWPHYVRPE